jgi:ubiquinone/menaquinone biosynthesis C-methylase UbiE
MVMRSTYEESDVHVRYDRGRTLDAVATRKLVELLHRYSPQPVGLVVDLGCGTGRFSGILAEAFGARVLGVEPAENMRIAAETKLHPDSVCFLAGTAENIPLDAGAADVVFMSQVFHHIADRRAVLREIRRVLRPAGRLFLRQTTLENLDSYFYQRFFPEARTLDERRLPSRAELHEQAGACGYFVTAVETLAQEIASSGQEYVEKVGLRTYSDLEYISEDAFRAGFDALRAYTADHPGFPRSGELDVFVLQTESRS